MNRISSGRLTAPAHSPLVERIVHWSTTHRWAAVGSWLAMLVMVVVASVAVGGDSAEDYDPGESGRASRVVDAQQVESEPRENVLIRSTRPGARFDGDPEAQAAVKDLSAALRGLPGAVTTVASPLDPEGARQVSADGRSGLITFNVAGPVDRRDQHLDAATEAVRSVQARHPRVRLAQAGDLSMSRAEDDIYAADFRRSEVLSVPLTLLVLVLVFGALIAAAIPVLLALTVVLTGIAALMTLDRWLPIGDNVAPLVLLIGMAVGVDYSLFYLRREREERAAGKSVAEALRITARTSGRAVVISGGTVIVSVAGLFLVGIDSFRGMAVGTMLVVGLAVIGSLTFLPAVLALLGHRVDRARVPWLGRRRTGAAESSVWSAVARAVVRRPLLSGGAALLLLLLTALPALDLRLADPAPTDDLPRGNATVAAFADIQQAFPGGPAPARVVIWSGRMDSPEVLRAVDGLHQQVAASGGALREPIQVLPIGEILVVKVPLAGSGEDPKSMRALGYLRNTALPATFGKVPGIQYGVTGRTAASHDLRSALVGRAPLVFGFVLAAAFLLLLLAFRSVAIPLVSVLLNLVSIAAAYGAVVWIFQKDHLGSVLGFTSYHGVISWLPLFMFVVLFGLSMDYHIFILTRIQERRLAGASHRDAVVTGIARSAGVVSSAAIIMVSVFSVFTTLSTVSFKMLGVGLSLAVFLDATIVRGVLLPAALAVLGRHTWTMPTWLAWIPDLGELHESPAQRSPEAHSSSSP